MYNYNINNVITLKSTFLSQVLYILYVTTSVDQSSLGYNSMIKWQTK